MVRSQCGCFVPSNSCHQQMRQLSRPPSLAAITELSALAAATDAPRCRLPPLLCSCDLLVVCASVVRRSVCPGHVQLPESLLHHGDDGEAPRAASMGATSIQDAKSSSRCPACVQPR